MGAYEAQVKDPDLSPLNNGDSWSPSYDNFSYLQCNDRIPIQMFMH